MRYLDPPRRKSALREHLSRKATRPDDRAGPRTFAPSRPSVVERPVPKTTEQDRTELKRYGFAGASERSNRRDKMRAFLFSKAAHAEPVGAEQAKTYAKHKTDVGEALSKQSGLEGLLQESALAAPGAGRIAHNVGHQLTDTAVHAPLGAAMLISDVTRDMTGPQRRLVTKLSGGRVNLGGQFIPTHTANLAKDVAVQTAKDFTEKDRQGYLLADLLMAAPTVAALPGKLATGVTRAGEASRAGKVGAFLKGVAEKPEPETFPLTKRSDVGEPRTVHRLLPTNSLAKKLAIVRNESIQRRLNNPGRPARLGAPTKAELVERYGLPERVAGAAEKLVAPQAKAGQFLSRHFGAEATFSRELRAERRIERDVARGPVSELHSAAGRPLGEAPILDRLPARLRKGISRGERKAIQALSIFGDYATHDPAGAIRRAVDDHTEKAAAAQQKIAEHDAAIQSLRDGAREAEHQGAYDELAQIEHQLQDELSGRDSAIAELERQQMQVADFKEAHPALERLRAGTASEAFQKSARLTRTLSEERKRRYMAEGLIDPDSATFRESAPAAQYEGSQQARETRATLETIDRQLETAHNPRVREVLESQRAYLTEKLAGYEDPLRTQTHVVRTHAENPKARALDAELERLDKTIEKLRDQFRRSAKRQRPRSRREAEHELARLEGEHDKLIERFKKAINSTPITVAEATAKIAELEQQIAEHATARETANAGLEQLAKDIAANTDPRLLEQRHGKALVRGVGAGGTRVTGHTYGTKHTAAIARAEKETRRLNLELGRHQEAAKTGRLRFPLDASETARRNLMRRSGIKTPTLAEELHQGALDAIEQAVAKHPDHPSFARYTAEHNAIERLREGLASLRDEADPIFGHGRKLDTDELAHMLGTVPVGADETVRHRMGALMEYRDQLERDMGRTLEKNVKLQSIADEIVRQRRELDQVPGAFRTPLSAPIRPARDVATRTQPGEYGVPKPNPRRRDTTLGHAFEGKEVEKGLLTADPVTAMIESYMKGLATVSNLEQYRDLWKVSESSRVHEGMVPVRNVNEVPKLLKLARRGDERKLPIAEQDLKELATGDLTALQRFLHPIEAGDGTKLYADELGERFNVPIGWKDPKGQIRWVDSRYFERFANTQMPDFMRRTADAINNPVRFARIYARVGYAANLVSNFGMQAISQGFLAPPNYRLALAMRDAMKEHLGVADGEHVSSIAESVVGEGKARSYRVGTGLGSRTTDAVAQFWSDFIDKYSRLSALIDEARRHGVAIPRSGKWTADGAHAFADFLQEKTPKRNSAIRRANKSMGEFNNLVPVERNWLRHVVFVYPWVSRATIWAGRTMVEHPGKVFTLAQLARIGETGQERDVGHLPSYLERRGYFGGSHAGFTIPGLIEKGKPWLVGTAPLNPLQTAPEVIQQLKGLLVGNADTEPQPEEALGPFLELPFGALGGATHGSKRGAKGGLAGAAGALIRSFPQTQALARSGMTELGPVRIGYNDNPRLRLEQRPVFAKRGLLEGLLPLLSPVPLPKEANLDSAHARYEQELLNAMPPEKRALYQVQRKTSEWLTAARRSGLYGHGEPWDQDMRYAIDSWTRRQVGYAHEAKRLDVPVNRLKQIDRFKVDLDMLVKAGLYTRADAAAELEAARSLDKEAIRAQRRELGDNYFGATTIRQFRHNMKEAGFPLK